MQSLSLHTGASDIAKGLELLTQGHPVRFSTSASDIVENLELFSLTITFVAAHLTGGLTKGLNCAPVPSH